jgi:uncharacterized membrane protein YfhO
MAIIIFRNFIFGGYLYIYQDIGIDTINSYYPYYLSFIKAINSGDLSFWFNNLGLGNNILSMSILFTDPFFLILLPFGTTHLVQGLLVKAIVSILCAGIMFYIYEGNFCISERAKVIGAILYAFSGYLILWGQHYHFATIIVFLPLLMHGYEVLLKKEKGLLLIIAVFLISFYSIYFLFMVSIFFLIYAIVRYVDCGEKNIKSFFRHFFKSLLCYFIGFGLSAIIMFPSLWVMLSSPRLHSDLTKSSLFSFNTLEYYVTTILRLFNYNSVGAGDHYFGFMNFYEAPILYSSLLSLFMIPFFFKSLDKRRVRIYLGLLVLILLFLTFPFFSAMFNYFKIIYYRWTFIINFLIIIAAAKGIDYYEENPSFKTILITSMVTVVLMLTTILVGNLYLPKIAKNVRISYIVLSRSIFFIITYVVLFMLMEIKWIKKYVKYMVLVVLMCELIVSSYTAVFKNRIVENNAHFSKRINYNDYTKEAIKYIKSIDNGVFRVEKNYSSQFFNSNLVQDYYGLKSYNSLNDNSTLDFLKKMEVPFYINQSYIKDFDNRHNLEQILGTRYYLMRGNQDAPRGYTFLNKFNDVSVFKNDYYLPLGFTYDKYIREKEFLELTKENKDKIIFKALIIDDDNKEIKTNEIRKEEMKSDDYLNNISERQKEELNFTIFKNGKIKGNIKIEDTEKTLFVSIPFDKGWKAKVDGKSRYLMKANLGFMAVNLEKGNHVIEIDYKQPFLYQGIITSSVSFIIMVILLWKKVI